MVLLTAFGEIYSENTRYFGITGGQDLLILLIPAI